MANVKIIGDAVILTSTMKLEDLELIQKTKPKALYLYEEDENGKSVPCFRIAVGEGEVRPSDVNENGITFRKASRDGGFAQITCKAPAGEGDVKDVVAEVFGGPLMSLKKLELALPDVIEEITRLKQAVLANIEVL